MAKITLTLQGSLKAQKTGEEPTVREFSSSVIVDETSVTSLVNAVKDLFLKVSAEVAKVLEEAAKKLPKPPTSAG